jgi:PAS domain S-box-containing protein
VLGLTVRAPWLVRALLAVLAGALAFGGNTLLPVGDKPFLLPLTAVLIVAVSSGFGAGLLCGGTALALANYYIMPPPNTFSVPSLADAYDLVTFAVAAAIVSMVGARGRRAQLTMRATLASIADAVIVSDEDGRVTYLNPVAEQLTGWSAEEALGQPVSDVFNLVHDETRAALESPLNRLVRNGPVVGLGTHAMLVARDGSEYAIAGSAAPLRDIHEKTIGTVLVFRDASRQRLTEAALKEQARERQELLQRETRARAEAEHANRLKDEFLATLSHELRTPLNAVLGWSHMLNRRQLTGEQQKQALAAIHRNAQAQARLVDDILDLSRIVTGRMALTAEPVDFAEVLRTTAESFAPAVLAKRQDLRLKLDADTFVTADPHRLRQVIWNLLSNATKFTPEEGVIWCMVARRGDRVELTVRDTGEGIEPSFLPFVFDRFRQGDSSSTRSHGGLGLGLSLVRYLVEAHGGSVFARSEGQGQGTTIGVTLPARTMTAQPPQTAPPATAPDLHGRRVLVLEDDYDSRLVSSVMLESMGATVRAFRTAEEALDAVSRDRFDLILADLAIPGTDGFEFLREVRKRNIATPALAVTAFSGDERRMAAYDAGFGAFVTKPVTPETLVPALRTVMQVA